jgi:hypothetical protein
MTKLHAWEKTSLDSVPDTHPVLPLIASLLLGVAVLAGTSSAPAAVCSAGLGVSMAISRSTRSARQYDSIRKYGCYSISLDETLLAEYIRANGLEHTKAEIVWAQEQDLLISEACENLIDGTTEAMPKRLPPQVPIKSTLSPGSPITDTNHQQPPQFPAIVPLVPQVVPIQPNTPPPSFDLIGEMSKAPENILIIAPSESGKGIVIGNLIAAFKASTDCSVTAIDPKGADTEGGFFAQCDRVHRFKSQLLGRYGIIAETKRGWKMFEDECIKWAGIKPCFILIDEMLVIGGCFKKASDTFLQDKIASLVSMGRSQRQFCWIATQYPQLDKLGIDGGIAGQMELLMIARHKNINLLKGWVKYDLTKLVKFDDAVSCCDDSPVNRAVCWRNDWYPMPLMQNHSGFDRESNTWVGGNENKPVDSTVADCGNSPATTPQAAPSDSVSDTVATCGDDVADVADTVAGDVLAFFNSVNTATPRTIRDIRMGRRIRKSGATAEDVQSAIDTLVMDGKLSLMNGGYVLPNWTTEDLN